MALFGRKIKKPEKKEVKKEEPTKAPVSIKTSAGKSPNKEKKIGLAWRVLRKAHITEKATDLTAKNQYVFNVFPQANKTQVKKSVEDLYGVDVVSVNIVNIPAKKRRLGRSQGEKPGYKKAIVKIKEGQEIELMPR